MLTKTIFELVGGEKKLHAFVDEFASRIKANPVLSPLYPEDMSRLKATYTEFATELFDGPKLFSKHHPNGNLHAMHSDIEITKERADEMVKCALETMDHFHVPHLVQNIARPKIEKRVYDMINSDS